MNPLLVAWDGPCGLPAFGRIRPQHFEPAFAQAMQQHRADIEAIGVQPQAPDFDNTLAAWDRAGRLLQQVRSVFALLCRCDLSPALQSVQTRTAAPLAAHDSWVLTHPAVFSRIEALHAARARTRLSAEQRRLLERVHLRCVNAGARLDAPQRERLAQVMQQLALLHARFAHNVLADEGSALLMLQDGPELAELPPTLRRAMQAAAQRLGLPAPYAVTPALMEPFLSHSPRADLRRQAWLMRQSQGEQCGPHDNRPVVREILRLRQEQAHLLGHASYADLALADRMAGKPATARRLLRAICSNAKQATRRERDALLALQREQGQEPGLHAWDWPYWSERQRQRAFGFSSEQLRSYFPLQHMLDAAFDCAGRLFGVRFEPRPRLRLYHPDVTAYAVRDDGRADLGLLLMDLCARPAKRGGAWVAGLRPQSRNGGPITAVVALNANFTGTPPVLLSLDEVRTLFHEMGHALHHLLSDVTYAQLAGNQVPRDFVELPSQLFERWMWEPQVLARHARHWQTGETMPPALLAALIASRRHGQGFHTLRRAASALVELAAHQHPGTIDDPGAFEAQVLRELGMPPEIAPRHRLVQFRHVFASAAYAAGYYGYLWADVLGADAHRAFREAGDAFDATLAARLKRCIYASGDSAAPQQLFRAYRQRAAVLSALLVERGFTAEPAGEHGEHDMQGGGGAPC